MLRGADVYDKSDQPQNPIKDVLKESAWNLVYAFELSNKARLDGLCSSMQMKSETWIAYARSEDPLDSKIPCGFHEKLDSFERLIILKAFRPETLLYAFNRYVSEKLGDYYSESPPSSMEELYSG